MVEMRKGFALKATIGLQFENAVVSVSPLLKINHDQALCLCTGYLITGWFVLFFYTLLYLYYTTGYAIVPVYKLIQY